MTGMTILLGALTCTVTAAYIILINEDERDE